MVLLIGLAVGVDYSMFYLKRAREERAAGRSERAALEAAAATSGRSVLISGLTVMVAMAGMFLTGDATFASFGVATILVVAIAMLGSLTVLPALLSRLGDRVDRARVPLVGRLRRDGGEGRVWGAIVDRVLRRPRRLRASLAGGLLVALAAAGAAAAHGPRRGRTRSRSRSPVVQTYNRMQQAFPGTALPANVVVEGAERERTRRARGDRPARAAGARERPDARADHGRRQHGRHRREHHRPDRRDGNRPRRRSLRSRTLRDEVVPADGGRRSRTSRPASPGSPAQWKDSTDRA